MSTVGLPLDADGKPRVKAPASPPTLKRKRDKKEAETEEADPPKSQPASPAAPAGDGTQVDEEQQPQDDKKAGASPAAADGESTPSAALKRLATTAAEVKSEDGAGDEKKDEDESASAAPAATEAAPPKAKKPKVDSAEKEKEKETDETEEDSVADEKPKPKKAPVASKPKTTRNAAAAAKGKGKGKGKRKTEAEILQGTAAKMNMARRRQGYDGCAGAIKALKRHYSNGAVDLDKPQSDSVFYGALATVARLADAKFGPAPHGSDNMVRLVAAREDMGDALIAAGRAINEKQRGLEAAEKGDEDDADKEDAKSTAAADADE